MSLPVFWTLPGPSAGLTTFWYWYVPFCATDATPRRVIASRVWRVKLLGLGLLACPVRLALGQEGFDAFLEVLRRVAGHDQIRVGALGDQPVANPPQRFFGRPERERSHRRNLVCERLRPGEQGLLVGRDLGN